MRRRSLHPQLDAEAVYLRLPVALQNVATSAVGWHTQRTRYNDVFDQILARLAQRTFWSVAETAAFRDGRLAQVVARAVASSSFYRSVFRDAGLDPTAVATLDDLAPLPILSRREAQERLPELISSRAPRHGIRMLHTSGTTGSALRFPTTMEAIREQWAVLWRYRTWHGISRETWSALFAGRSVVPARQQAPPFWRVNRFGRQLVFSGYHMAPDNLRAYALELRRRRPPWLHGYPSLLSLLGAFLLDSGFDLGYQVRFVTTGAENLLPHQRDLIQRAFGVAPLQHYGQTEGVAQISECEQHALHVDEDFSAVEFVPMGQSGVYRLVATNLANPATTFLRYDTGDRVVIRSGASCACGRPGRIVDRIDGRLEDYVILENGVRVGRMDHVFKDMVNVQEAQIYQERPGALTLRVVRGTKFDAGDEQALRRETEKRVGDRTEIAIEYWESLPRSPMGKLRFVVSDIAAGSIEADLARSDT